MLAFYAAGPRRHLNSQDDSDDDTADARIKADATVIAGLTVAPVQAFEVTACYVRIEMLFSYIYIYVFTLYIHVEMQFVYSMM